MFNSTTSREEKFELQKKIDDLRRENEYLRRDREIDDERIRMREMIDGQNKRLDHIEAKYKAIAAKEAAEAVAKMSEAYADKAVKMAATCAADFGNATGKALEQVMALLKEFKPTESKINILPVPSPEVTISTEQSA